MTIPGLRPGTAPVARALAKAATARDVQRLRQHEDSARYHWGIEYDGDVLVTVTLNARAAHYDAGKTDQHVVRLDCESYDQWPPEVHFVNPTTRVYTIPTDIPLLPAISGMYGFAIHPVFSNFYQVGRIDQLVCFSYSRGYYDSSHSPQPHERWRPGRHWLYSTVQYLYRALQPPYYQGRIGG